MSAHEEERARAKERLARYRVGTSERFRFMKRRHRAFVVACVFAGLGLAVPAFEPDYTLGEVVMVRIMGLVGVLAMSLLLPKLCWFEIEQRSASWIFRWRAGWWRRVIEVPTDEIALATVIESRDEYGRTVDRGIQVARIAKPFARGAPSPVVMVMTGWPPRDMLAICRMITPGYAAETYLLQTNMKRGRWLRGG